MRIKHIIITLTTSVLLFGSCAVNHYSYMWSIDKKSADLSAGLIIIEYQSKTNSFNTTSSALESAVNEISKCSNFKALSVDEARLKTPFQYPIPEDIDSTYMNLLSKQTGAAFLFVIKEFNGYANKASYDLYNDFNFYKENKTTVQLRIYDLKLGAEVVSLDVTGANSSREIKETIYYQASKKTLTANAVIKGVNRIRRKCNCKTK